MWARTTTLLKSRRTWLVILAGVAAWYAASYPRGMVMAYIDHAFGHYEVQGWGFPPPWMGDYKRLLKENYGVTYRSVGGCMVFPTVGWYAEGYSSVSGPRLQARYGKDIFAECATLAEERWDAEHPGWRGGPR